MRSIRLFGDPVLTVPAAPVTGFDRELQELVRDLTDTMIDADGAGLAAPQIGVSQRVFVYAADGRIGHLVNPTIVERSADTQVGDEGCLSFPGLFFPCERAHRVVAHGFTAHGEPVTVDGSELLARALQHETDHLDGVLFIDRLDPATRKRANRAIREAEWVTGRTPTVKLSPHPVGGSGR